MGNVNEGDYPPTLVVHGGEEVPPNPLNRNRGITSKPSLLKRGEEYMPSSSKDSVIPVKTGIQTNSAKVESGLKLLTCLDRQGHTLDLTDRFEAVWKSLDQQGAFERVDTIYFWLGPRAGFTDTRVIFIWLKSWEMFNNEKLKMKHEKLGAIFFVLKLAQSIIPESLEEHEIVELMKQSEQNMASELAYSAEPRIGIKS